MTHISEPLDNLMEKLLQTRVRPEDRLKFRAIYESKKKEFKKLNIDSLRIQEEAR